MKNSFMKLTILIRSFLRGEKKNSSQNPRTDGLVKLLVWDKN